MARPRHIGLLLLSLLLLWLGLRHLSWSGYWLSIVGLEPNATQNMLAYGLAHGLAHGLGLCSGVVACAAAWLTWRRRPAAIAAVWGLVALALATTLLQWLLSASAREAWAQQWPLKLLYEGGFWALVLAYLHRQQRRGGLPS